MRPSIIFFDEIDGLAPVRSSRQDQNYSSIVSSLLALMDGLDARGEVVVIGATVSALLLLCLPTPHLSLAPLATPTSPSFPLWLPLACALHITAHHG